MPDRPRDIALASLKPRYLQILLSLAEGPRHGYGVMQDVVQRSDGKERLWPAALYGSLRELSELGLVEETNTRPPADDDDERRRYYRLTPRGRRALEAEVRRLEDIVRVARKAGIAFNKS